MPYQSLEELRKEHTDEQVFRAAMNWLLIQDQAKWRAEYKRVHGQYPTLSQGHEHRHESRYCVPPKPIRRELCVHCNEPCKVNEHKEWVCQNPKCFSYGS